MGDTGWIGVGLAAVTVFGSVFGAMVKRRADRDKMEFDAKFRDLELKHTHCEEGHATTADALAVTQRKLEACEEKHEETDRRLSAVEAAQKK